MLPQHNSRNIVSDALPKFLLQGSKRIAGEKNQGEAQSKRLEGMSDDAEHRVLYQQKAELLQLQSFSTSDPYHEEKSLGPTATTASLLEESPSGAKANMTLPYTPVSNSESSPVSFHSATASTSVFSTDMTTPAMPPRLIEPSSSEEAHAGLTFPPEFAKGVHSQSAIEPARRLQQPSHFDSKRNLEGNSKLSDIHCEPLGSQIDMLIEAEALKLPAAENNAVVSGQHTSDAISKGTPTTNPAPPSGVSQIGHQHVRRKSLTPLQLEDIIRPIHCAPMKVSALQKSSTDPGCNETTISTGPLSPSAPALLPPAFVKRYVLGALGLCQGLKPELSKDGTGGTYFLRAGDLEGCGEFSKSALTAFLEEGFDPSNFVETEDEEATSLTDKPSAAGSSQSFVDTNSAFQSVKGSSISTPSLSTSTSSRSEESHHKVLVFKPQDEEAFAPHNPRGYSGALGHFSFRPGIRSGEGHSREVAAWLLDHGSFAGVPVTVEAELPIAAFVDDLHHVFPSSSSSHELFQDTLPSQGGGKATDHPTTWAAWCATDPSLRQLASGKTDPLARAARRNFLSRSHQSSASHTSQTKSSPLSDASPLTHSVSVSFRAPASARSLSLFNPPGETAGLGVFDTITRSNTMTNESMLSHEAHGSTNEESTSPGGQDQLCRSGTRTPEPLSPNYESERRALIELIEARAKSKQQVQSSDSTLPQAQAAPPKARTDMQSSDKTTTVEVVAAPPTTAVRSEEKESRESSSCKPRPWKPKWKLRQEQEALAKASNPSIAGSQVAESTMSCTSKDPVPAAPTVSTLQQCSAHPSEDTAQKARPWKPKWKLRQEAEAASRASTENKDGATKLESEGEQLRTAVHEPKPLNVEIPARQQPTITPLSTKRRPSRFVIMKPAEIPEPMLNQPLELGRIAAAALPPTALQSPTNASSARRASRVFDTPTHEHYNRPESSCSLQSGTSKDALAEGEADGDGRSYNASTSNASSSETTTNVTPALSLRQLDERSPMRVDIPNDGRRVHFAPDSATQTLRSPSSTSPVPEELSLNLTEDLPRSASRDTPWSPIAVLARTFSTRHFVGPVDRQAALEPVPSPVRSMSTSMPSTNSPPLGSNPNWSQTGGFASPAFTPLSLPNILPDPTHSSSEEHAGKDTVAPTTLTPQRAIATQPVGGDIPEDLLDDVSPVLNSAGATPQLPSRELNQQASATLVTRKKLGSLQEYVIATSTSEDISYSLFPDLEVQKIAILDLRMLNLDRNTANVLVRRKRVPVRRGPGTFDKDAPKGNKAKNASQDSRSTTSRHPAPQSTPFFSPILISDSNIPTGLTPMYLGSATPALTSTSSGPSIVPSFSLNDHNVDHPEQHSHWLAPLHVKRSPLPTAAKRLSISSVPTPNMRPQGRGNVFTTMPATTLEHAMASRSVSPGVRSMLGSEALNHHSTHSTKITGIHNDHDHFELTRLAVDENSGSDTESLSSTPPEHNQVENQSVQATSDNRQRSAVLSLATGGPAHALSNADPITAALSTNAFDNIPPLTDAHSETNSMSGSSAIDYSPSSSLFGFVFERNANPDPANATLVEHGPSYLTAENDGIPIALPTSTLVPTSSLPHPEHSHFTPTSSDAGSVVMTVTKPGSSMTIRSLPAPAEALVHKLYRFDRYRASVADKAIKAKYREGLESLKGTLHRSPSNPRHRASRSSHKPVNHHSRGGPRPWKRGMGGSGGCGGGLGGSHGCSSQFTDQITLIPIDHAYTLPDTLCLEEDYLCWLAWPQAARPCVPEVLDYVRSLDVEHDARMLAEHPTLHIRPECLRLFKVAGITLQKALDRGFTLRDVGLMLCKRVVERDPVTGRFRRASSWLNEEIDDAWVWSDDESKAIEEAEFDKEGESSSDCSLDDDDKDTTTFRAFRERAARLERGRVEFQTRENDDELPCEISQLLDQCEALGKTLRDLTKLRTVTQQKTFLSHAQVHQAAMRRNRACRACGKRILDPEDEVVDGYASVPVLHAIQILLSEDTQGRWKGEVDFRNVVKTHRRSMSAPPDIKYKPWDSGRVETAGTRGDDERQVFSAAPPPNTQDARQPPGRADAPSSISFAAAATTGKGTRHSRLATVDVSGTHGQLSHPLVPDLGQAHKLERSLSEREVSGTPPKSSPQSSPRLAENQQQQQRPSLPLDVPTPAQLGALALPPLSSPELPTFPTLGLVSDSVPAVQERVHSPTPSRSEKSGAEPTGPQDSSGKPPQPEVLSDLLAENNTIPLHSTTAPHTLDDHTLLINPIDDYDIDFDTYLAKDSMLAMKAEHLKTAPLYSPLYFYSFTDLIMLAQSEDDFVLLAFRKLLDGFLDFKMSARCAQRERDLLARLAARRQWVEYKLSRRQKRQQLREMKAKQACDEGE